MALPTLQNLKDYLRIETTADDTRLTAILARAQAVIETWLDRPIASREVTVVDLAEPDFRQYVTALRFDITPFDTASLTIVDRDAAAVDADTYRLESDTGLTGIIRAERGYSFGEGPYTLTADAGLAEHPDYAAVIEPTISAAILDLASEYHHRTSPGEASRSSGGGISSTYQDGILPKRLEASLMPWKRWRVT